MSRILILINTYYQLIVAMQLKNTKLSNEDISLLVSDDSLNTENIVEQLIKKGIFTEVIYVKKKGLVKNRRAFDKFKDFIDISFNQKNRYSYYLDGLKNMYFDEMICYNFSIDNYGLYADLSKFNPNIKISFFEEGVLSYKCVPFDTFGRRIIRFFRKMQNKLNITDAFYKYYCFLPELYGWKLPVEKIPMIEKESQTIKELKEIFYAYIDKNVYKEKYIYFTSVYDFEGGDSIGEFDIVCKIADIVGKDNLLVKVHPRDERNIYLNNGFKVDKNSNIPWEVIQLSNGFTNKAFITTNSGSVLGGSLITGQHVKTYFTYNLCKIQNNASAKKTVNSLEKILCNKNMKKYFNNISVFKNIDQVKSEFKV